MVIFDIYLGLASICSVNISFVEDLPLQFGFIAYHFVVYHEIMYNINKHRSSKFVANILNLYMQL